jgi:hypothetical protein
MQQTFGMPANNMQQSFEIPANSMQQTLGANTLQYDPSIMMAQQHMPIMHQKNSNSAVSHQMPIMNGMQTVEADSLMSEMIAPAHNMNGLNNLAKLSKYSNFDSHAELPSLNNMISHTELSPANMIGGGTSGIHNLAKLNKNIKKTTNSGISNLAKLL